ncbi:MAG: hypothetical protein RIB67_07425 [Miltoncostaeaceae bacterium]
MPVHASTIADLAAADVGRAEQPLGSNRGPWLDPIQRRVSAAHGWAATFLLGQPWCGTWGYDVQDRAGMPDPDNPSHPSTEQMWLDATARGTLTDRPVPGAMIVWRGIHTGIVVAVDEAAGVVHTIEGNSSDRVSRRVRPIRGTHRYIVPAGLTQAAPVQTLYWLEDPGAKFRVWGPWLRKRSAEKTLAGLPPARRARAEILRTGPGRLGIRRWVIREGQPRHYGPGLSEAWREAARPVLEERLGRRLRPYNTRRPMPSGASTPAGAAQALGKTT